MIAGILHAGSGLGNQLHRYVMTRVVAADLGVPFGMIAPEHFKGFSFMDLDVGETPPATYVLGPGGEVVVATTMSTFLEEKVVENGIDIRGYDHRIKHVQDNTLIDGEFQDQRYFEHRMKEIGEWLYTQYLGMPNDVCVIGFRGGEFQYFPDLYLTKEYWQQAMDKMREIIPHMKFVAVTDDPQAARAMLPSEVRITHEIGSDWRMIRSARYLILANSSFFILPALLNNNVQKVIAPRYWARRNIGGPWATEQNYYGKFSYL